jgi:Matrixin
MNTWNAAPRQNFAFVSTPGAMDHIGAYDMGQWNGWLAMTYTQPQTSGTPLSSGQVLVNLYYEWNPPHPAWKHTDPGGPYDLESVLTHEFGHLLHLNDDVTANDVMQPTIHPHVVRRALGVDDLAGISHLYPMLSALTPTELSVKATTVIQGRVTANNYAVVSLRIAVEPVFIELYFSVSRVAVVDTWKGHGLVSPEIDVLTMGARTPEVSFHVSSEAALGPNEEVVLYLSRDHTATPSKLESVWNWNCYSPMHGMPHYPPGATWLSFSVFGGFQGKYTVYRQGETAYVWRPGLPPSVEGGLRLTDLREQSLTEG